MSQKQSILIVFGLLVTSVLAENSLPTKQGLRDIVKARFADQFVYIGGTMGFRELNSEMGTILNREFSYITPENDYKQSAIHPRPDVWRWKQADGWVESAKANDQVIRIHGPISPQCSTWAKEDSRTAEELLQNLEEYMTALCQRYNHTPEVLWLDVVNETIDLREGWMGPKPGTDAWENPWTKIGFETNIPEGFPILQEYGVPLYIIRAFEIANEHADNLELVINQHGLLDERVIAHMKELVRYLRKRGLRVDAVGWQAHLWRNWQDWARQDPERIALLESYIDWAHENGLGFHITENDVYVKKDAAVDEAELAAAYRSILQTLLKKRHRGEVGWNLWTLADELHYQDKNKLMLGLWDEDYKPKKAYYELKRVLKETP